MNITQPYAEDITYPDFNDYVSGNILPSGLPSGDAIKASSAAFSPAGTSSSVDTAAASSIGSKATGVSSGSGSEAHIVTQGSSASKGSANGIVAAAVGALGMALALA